uniref:DUF4760 domain-containing protein n=1 Tax=candidate division WOR-3 bacterium TaxID=2052148 RepID=A0A7C2P131_UNCW3
MNNIIYIISAIATITGLSGYLYYSMRKILREIAKTHFELAIMLEKMSKIATLYHEDWVAESKDLINLINESRKRDKDFERRNSELIALSLALQHYIESISLAPEPINKPVLQEFYEKVGEKLKGYVEAIKKGQRRTAKDHILELIAMLSKTHDFIKGQTR